MTVAVWVWAAFVAAVVLLLALDLVVFHRTPHRVSLREAALYSLLWVGLGVGFAGVLWLAAGDRVAGEYLAGYLIEKSLSLDNVFVFALVFSSFAVPPRLQYRVLFWGVVGAILLRAAFIAAGAALLAAAEPVVYLFGAFLVVTGVRVARHETRNLRPERNPLLRLLRRVLPFTDGYRGDRFLVREGRQWRATPLVAALVVVAAFDVLFAVDSIPAVFAITREPFLVFAANAFSLLGLRALAFLLAGSLGRFRYLDAGLGAILVFVGAKMLLADLVHVPIWLSLAAVAATLAVAIGASVVRRDRDRPSPDAPAERSRYEVGTTSRQPATTIGPAPRPDPGRGSRSVPTKEVSR